MDKSNSTISDKNKSSTEPYRQSTGSRSSLIERRASKRFNILKQIVLDVIEEQAVYENYTPIKNKVKSQEDITFILQSLKKHFVFNLHTDFELLQLIDHMFYCEVSENQFILKQGDMASSFFIIDKGVIEVTINDKIIRDLKQGDGFGELALLYNAPRFASCRTKTPAFLWGIERKIFKEAVERMNEKNYEDSKKFMNKIQFFENLTQEQKDQVASIFIAEKFEKGQYIVHENDSAASFYIVKSGKVACVKNNQELRILVEGESFGESGLLEGDQKRLMSIVAKETTILLSLGKDNLKKLLGQQVELIIYKNIAKWALEKCEGYKELNQNYQNQILGLVDIVHLKPDETYQLRNKPMKENIVLILQGQFKYETSKEFAGKKFDVFGMTEFYNQSFSFYHEDLLSVEDGVIGIIQAQKIVEQLKGYLKDVIQRQKIEQPKKSIAPEDSKQNDYVKTLALNDLVILKGLGEGQFGHVYLVKIIGNDNQLFALKCIEKATIIKQKFDKLVQQEKQTMEMINTPLIMKFVRSFKDEYYIYFLLEFVPGIELFDAIREIGLLDTRQTQFYVAQMILQIEYLHQSYIIYRDLKPENIMVTKSGYLKLIDMGSAKNMKTKSGLMSRTYSIIGTPHYMAPEIVSGKGYGFPADIWSIGICFYEFICGAVPFGEEKEDPYEIYEEIIKSSINYSSDLDVNAVDLMNIMLNKTPELRLQGGKFDSIKSHKFFEGFDWQKIVSQESKDVALIPTIDMNQYSKESVKIMEETALNTKKTILDVIKVDNNGVLNKPRGVRNQNWDEMF